MNISITKHFEEFVERQVQSGRYNNSSEVIRAALRLLEEKDRETEARLAGLRAAVGKGIEELDSGQGRTFDPDRIKREGRRRSAQQTAS